MSDKAAATFHPLEGVAKQARDLTQQDVGSTVRFGRGVPYILTDVTAELDYIKVGIRFGMARMVTTCKPGDPVEVIKDKP